MPDVPLLKLENACFGYSTAKDAVPIIKNVSLSLTSGDFALLQGPNGCGKTTLLRGILGMVPLGEGNIHWSIPMEKLGYVPQESAMDIGGPASALDVVRSSRPFHWRTSAQAAMEALDTVGLSFKAKSAYGDLSGGQKRRVIVARALAVKPALMILDEPTANVDAKTVADLESLLTRLCREDNMAVLATAHDADWAQGAKRLRVEGGTLHV